MLFQCVGFQEVSRKIHGNFKGVSRKFQGLKGISCSFMWFLRVFERSSTGVSGKFQWCLKGFQGSFQEVSRIFQGNLKKVPRKIEGCFKGVFRGFQGYLKEIHGISEKFEVCLKCV